MNETVRPSVFVPDRKRPVAPVPPPARLPRLKALSVVKRNPIEVFPAEAYSTPIFATGWRWGVVLIVNDPAAVERIFVTNAANYRKSVQQQRRLVPALGDGLLTAEGELWRSGRRVAAPLFSPKAVAALYEDMSVAAAAMLERWQKSYAAGQPFDVTQEYYRLTYEIVSRTVFSGALDDDRLHVHEKMALYFDTIGRVDLASFLNLPGWVPSVAHWRARSSIAVFREVLSKAFRQRQQVRASGKHRGGDLLDRLIEAKDPETGKEMPSHLVLDNVLTFLAAGHETTANALSWISYLLATYPWADEQLAEELTSVLAGRPAERADLDRLPFARALVDETMRLYPPAPFMGRDAIGEDELAGMKVRPNTPVLIAPWIIHRHKHYWSDPDLFSPQRFLSPNKEKQVRGAYLPFGLGPRICIGAAFAIQEIMTVLSVIVPHFRFELAKGADISPLARITLQPQHGVKVVLKPRA